MSDVAKLAVLGHPISHSLSPVMHEAAYQALGICASYTAIDVLPDDLYCTLQAFCEEGYRGVNLTIPHKVAAVFRMDEITARAKRIGAVNTVTFENGRMHGDNTDGEGWLRSFVAETGFTVADKQAVVLGAGGAARAIVDTLLFAQCKTVTILNRSVDRAQRLVNEMALWHRHDALFCGSLHDVDLSNADLIVNTTSVGLMGALQDQAPVSLDTVKSGAIVSDIVYRPRVTRLLSDAKAHGATVHEGLGMLLYQGALAIKRWFGVFPPIEPMKDAVVEVLDQGR